MRRILLLLTVIGSITLSSCSGDTGPRGASGPDSEVFELQNINFQLDQNNEYTIFQQLNPQLKSSDNILIYRMAATINPQTPIWQLIPRTLFLTQGQLDYDFDFSKVDFTIYAGGNFNIATVPQFINNQTFRIVIIPGYFSKNGSVDINDYNAVIKAYTINDTKVTVLNKK